MEQLSRILSDDAPVPECVAVAPVGPLANALHALAVPTLTVPAAHVPDVRPLLNALYARITKQWVSKGLRHLPKITLLI